jgi:hypothetical protein
VKKKGMYRKQLGFLKCLAMQSNRDHLALIGNKGLMLLDLFMGLTERLLRRRR